MTEPFLWGGQAPTTSVKCWGGYYDGQYVEVPAPPMNVVRLPVPPTPTLYVGAATGDQVFPSPSITYRLVRDRTGILHYVSAEASSLQPW